MVKRGFSRFFRWVVVRIKDLQRDPCGAMHFVSSSDLDAGYFYTMGIARSPEAQGLRSTASAILVEKGQAVRNMLVSAERVAMANQTTAVEVQGEVSGQIAVGKNILQIGPVYGDIVNVAERGQQARPKARSVPIQLRPRPFPSILDRTEESTAAIRALESQQSVEVFGEPGIGKTVLLRHLAHTIDSEHFREGIIYREIHDDPPGDVLQVLWGDFFECDVPFKPTNSQLRSDLQSKQALIIFDAVELSRAEVEQVMNVARACTFLLGSPERHLWEDDTHATHLVGLPAKDTKTLVERELGRPLTEDEASALETVTIALKGNPLRVLQEVAMARLNDRSLTSIAQDLQSDGSPEKLTARITAPLSDVEHRMLSALAIFSGASVRATTLGELLQVDDAETILEDLEDRHLVRAIRGRYKLAGEVAPFTPKETKTTEERKRAVAYFADWIERHQREVKTILETLPVLMRCLRWGVQFGMAAEVIRITKLLELTLVLNGRWESWANALNLAAQSAISASDKAALGWVRHQNGTKALCEGNLPEARESLEQALQIREALRDRAGADVTRHNLNLVARLTMPPWKLLKLPVGMAAITCALIATMVFASKIPKKLWPLSRTPALTATTTPAPTRSRTATTARASRAPSRTLPPPTGSAATGYPPSGISPFIPPVIAPTVPVPTRISPVFPPVIVLPTGPEENPRHPPSGDRPPSTAPPKGPEENPRHPPSGDRPPSTAPSKGPEENPRHPPSGDRPPSTAPPKGPEENTGHAASEISPVSPPHIAPRSTKPTALNVTRPVTGPAPRGAQGGKQKSQRAYAHPGGAPSGGPAAAAGRGQVKPESAKKTGEKGSPTLGPHLGVPPAGIRILPSAPRDWPPYTRDRALKRPRERPTPPH
jgi:hypothetical protein